MSAQSENSALEQLKELVKTNGNQAAAILDAVIEVLSQSTPTYAGNNGNVMQSDGDGGIVANAKVSISAGGNIEADGKVIAHDIEVSGSISSEGNIAARGIISAGGTISADGNVGARGNISAGGKVVTIDDVVVGGNVVIGDKTHSNSIHLFSPNGQEYAVTVDDSGQLIITPVV